MTYSPRTLVLLIGGILIYGGNEVTQALDIYLSRLPVEGIHAQPVPPIIQTEKIYPLMTQSQERLEQLETVDIDAVFQRAVAPKPVAAPPPPEPPKPKPVDLLMQIINVSGMSDAGAFINGRYFLPGEAITSLEQRLQMPVKLLSIHGCELMVAVGPDRAKLRACK